MSEQDDVCSTLHALVKAAKNPAEILEIYYWSQERDLSALMRALAKMPCESRQALLKFVSLCHDKRAINVTSQGEGSITLGLQLSPGANTAGAC